LIGICAAAALCASLAVQAQTGGSQGGAGQGSTSQGGTAQGGAGQGGTGQSGTGQSGTGQSGSGQSGSGQSGSGMTGGQGASGQGGTQGSTASGTGTGAGTGTGTGTATIASADRKIVTDLAMANMSEIEAARTAQTKSQNDQVKKYAQQMIDDHTKALDEVRQLAQTKGVTLPSTLDRAHKAKADKLAALSGDAFDRAYMAQAGVAEHKKTHGMLTKAQGRAKDPDVKALVTRMTPTVDQHLNSAKELHGNMSKATGSSGTATEKSGQ
jgi:putative membrane protein